MLEFFPITTEHSSEKQKFFQVSNAQFLRALVHLIRSCFSLFFFVLITIDFLIVIALQRYSVLQLLQLPNVDDVLLTLKGFSAKKAFKMWSVDAPTFVLTFNYTLASRNRILNVDGRHLYH